MKTYMAKPGELEKKWYIIDAEGQTLGRLATEVANILRGKNKPNFTPFVDTGDYVIIINAAKVKFSGKKLDQKVYLHHTGYVGGLKSVTLREQLAKKPEEVVKHAVFGMIPAGTLGESMKKKLHVYAGPDYEQQAQKPEAYELKKRY